MCRKSSTTLPSDFRAGSCFPIPNETIVLIGRGTVDRYVMLMKTADESTIYLLLMGSQQEPLTVYAAERANASE